MTLLFWIAQHEFVICTPLIPIPTTSPSIDYLNACMFLIHVLHTREERKKKQQLKITRKYSRNSFARVSGFNLANGKPIEMRAFLLNNEYAIASQQGKHENMHREMPLALFNEEQN